MMTSELPCSPAAERNQQPILTLLQRLVPDTGHALEIASGTGQHVSAFAAAMPGWTWQPSDWQTDGFASIAGWCQARGAANVRPAVQLDVRHHPWPDAAAGAPFDTPFDLIYCANMLHIAPWDCCAGLMHGAAHHLAPGGQLITYGPFLELGVPTAPGNLAFDASLRAQNPEWGLRRLDEVAQEARAAGLHLAARHAMPANNLLLVWRGPEPAHAGSPRQA